MSCCKQSNTSLAFLAIYSSSTLIIGASNFGAATALSLKKGDVKVTLVDSVAYPSPRAASHDIKKIVPDDYPNRLYMRMLAKAMPRADSTSFGEESIASYRDMGIANDSELLPVEKVRRRWNGALATADFKGVDQILYKSRVVFAEADKALGAVVQAASSLEFGDDDQSRCTGVKLWDDRTLHAHKVLLATAAISFYAKVRGAQSLPANRRGHSVVPDQSMYNTWTGPRFLKFFEDRARRMLNGLYGKEVGKINRAALWMCCHKYASPPTHDFVISPHPHCNNLYLATGGSFHGWKFLPAIGGYVVDMIQGS
ncbi:hypothetical protein EDB81DRAFT_873546 [Dactylonectria macrodidyma]|uniref:FAD dependent oxidoreductase domain-containing protein n=1 Tax=Dactylonectria macrodidyma TaxID=307937 RepID=A0A9P9D6R8_9HYPO|nr:hypothetical protein EDB81DRAFT_873546 [Dactylonectria macrodidyma]